MVFGPPAPELVQGIDRVLLCEKWTCALPGAVEEERIEKMLPSGKTNKAPIDLERGSIVAKGNARFLGQRGKLLRARTNQSGEVTGKGADLAREEQAEGNKRKIGKLNASSIGRYSLNAPGLGIPIGVLERRLGGKEERGGKPGGIEWFADEDMGDAVFGPAQERDTGIKERAHALPSAGDRRDEERIGVFCDPANLFQESVGKGLVVQSGANVLDPAHSAFIGYRPSQDLDLLKDQQMRLLTPIAQEAPTKRLPHRTLAESGGYGMKLLLRATLSRGGGEDPNSMGDEGGLLVR